MKAIYDAQVFEIVVSLLCHYLLSHLLVSKFILIFFISIVDDIDDNSSKGCLVCFVRAVKDNRVIAFKVYFVIVKKSSRNRGTASSLYT